MIVFIDHLDNMDMFSQYLSTCSNVLTRLSATAPSISVISASRLAKNVINKQWQSKLMF